MCGLCVCGLYVNRSHDTDKDESYYLDGITLSNPLTSKLRLVIISATDVHTCVLSPAFGSRFHKFKKIFPQLSNFIAINRIYLLTAHFKVVCRYLRLQFSKICEFF